MKRFCKSGCVLATLRRVNTFKSNNKFCGPKPFPIHSALYHQHVKQVYLFDNTDKNCLEFKEPYSIVNDLKKFGVRTVKGGFRRRPELIKARVPDLSLQTCWGSQKTYGLFDKCERIQQELTEKVLELMHHGSEVDAGTWMLDIACGHGWSLTVPASRGVCVTGADFDLQALSVIQHKIHTRYLPVDRVHVLRTDISNGLCFREGLFDFAISVSFLQWLCVGKRSKETLDRFFCSLSFVLKPGGKAGIQFYPRSVNDVSKVIQQAQQYFKGALVSDFPHLDRGRKLFLVLVNKKL